MVSEEHPTSRPPKIPPIKRMLLFGDKNHLNLIFIMGLVVMLDNLKRKRKHKTT
jgi:hypothetical protein